MIHIQLRSLPHTVTKIPRWIFRALRFFLRKQKVMMLVFVYLLYIILEWLSNVPLLKTFARRLLQKPIDMSLNLLYRVKIDTSGLNSVNLISMGIKNITYKKARSFITIGGMAIGIGSIVFLLSVGYGLQRMVVTRVARLDELKQANISAQPGSRVRINDEKLSTIRRLDGVKNILPLISVVGRVNYNNSVIDLAVYGVTADYLRESAERTVNGKLFSSNELVHVVPRITQDELGVVAGVATHAIRAEMGSEIGSIEYTLLPDVWVPVHKEATLQSPVIGYAKRATGKHLAEVILGLPYPGSDHGDIDIYTQDAEDTQHAGKWIRDSFDLWEQAYCDPVNVDCDSSGEYRRITQDERESSVESGFITMQKVSVSSEPIRPAGEVLGLEANASTADMIDIRELSASASVSASLAEIASESATLVKATKNVDISKTAKREAVVNRAMLSVLNIKEQEAIGKEFETTFVVTGDLLNEADAKIESLPLTYKIVGVIPQDETPFFYVPFIDLRSLGVQNYSQAKLIAQSESALARSRQQVEGLGFLSVSAADTVAQIDGLFRTIRFLLLALGIVALGVAAMGMFNTLTVSLLERTHEVGLMKTMGMKSNEIENLFLVESVIMGVLGGIAGLILGFASGKFVGLVLTLFAIRGGGGIVDISYIPPMLVLAIALLSLAVGFFTGIYPAQRARMISALNALHYE